jgi:hypothetical protein
MAMRAPTAPAAAPGVGRLASLLFSRWIPEFLENKAITLGGAKVTKELDNVGYGDMIVLHVKGTYTVATANLVLLAGAPWNVVNPVLSPPGLMPPISQSGFMTHLWNLIGRDFAPFVDGGNQQPTGLDANAFDLAQTDVFPLAIGAQTIHLWYVLPLHRSSMDPRGVLSLGNKGRTQLSLSIAAAADLVTTAANLTVPVFTVDFYQAYLTSPAEGLGIDFDPWWSVAYEEIITPIVALGNQVVNVEPNDTILGLIHYVIMNGVGDSADVNNLTLRVNKSYYHQALPGDFWHYVQRRRLGIPLPVGVIAYDFDRFADVDVEGPLGLEPREWLHSENVTSIQSTLNVPTGTLGTNPRVITGVRRLVDLDPSAH